jgi:hypothetical protein
MPTGTETFVWPKLCEELMDALSIQHGCENDQFKRVEKLYDRCINTCIPNNVRATDDDAMLRDQLRAFHASVLESIKHIQAGWPSTTRAELRDTLTSTENAYTDPSVGAIGGSDREVMDRAINVALCLWLSIDCVDKLLGARIWPEAETVEHFVLKHRFVVLAEADHVRYFPPDFRAGFLKEISGISIEQTYHLDQHLRFNEETRTVSIFMDIAWLKVMIQLFQNVIDNPNGSNGNGPPANVPGGHASAGCQQNLQVDDQFHGDSHSQDVTQNSSSTGTTALPTGNK